jgi:UDP-glucuronate 4-epimerase
VVGLDLFDDFYDPRVKEENVAGCLKHDGYELVRGDIRDQATLNALPGGIDAVVHLAAKAGVRPSIDDPVGYASVNVVGTSTFLRWAGDRDIGSFVLASSSSVYGNNERVPFSESDPVDHPISPYAATKRATELLAHAAFHLGGMTVACLRIFTVYGPRQRPDLAIHKFARILAEGGAIPMFGDGSSSRDYTFVADTVSGVIGAPDWANRSEGGFDIFNLGNNRTVTLSEMISTLAEEMGVTPRIERLPMQPGDVDRTYADIERARSVIGYNPTTTFREGVRQFVDWLAD